MISDNRFLSIISTKSIAEGDTREGSLEYILKYNGDINFAIKNLKWPGRAAVLISLISIYKGVFTKQKYLNNKHITQINSFLENTGNIRTPNKIIENSRICFKGSEPLGDGFLVSEEEAKNLITTNSKNKDVLFKYLNGSDLNNDPELKPSRWIVNFFDWTEEKSMEYIECYNIIKEKVKPERDLVERKARREKWWQYGEKAVGLYNAIRYNKRILLTAFTSKYLFFNFHETGLVFSNATIICSNGSTNNLSILQSSLHEIWVFQFCSTLGISMRYAPSDVFETFPFPQNLSKDQETKLEQIGEQYHEHRRQLMLSMQLGLTKTYNAFHAKEVQLGITTATLQALDKKAIEKQYGKEVWNLWNHLQKTPNTCTIEEAIAGIVKLRQLHVEMDEAVLGAYGWSEECETLKQFETPQTSKQYETLITSETKNNPGTLKQKEQNPIKLAHDFYEVDYLPENDRIRYTIHPNARKEVLKRLLLLNHERYEEELKQGLHKKEDAEKFYKKKGVEMPFEVSQFYVKGYKLQTGKGKKAEEPKEKYGQGELGI